MGNRSFKIIYYKRTSERRFYQKVTDIFAENEFEKFRIEQDKKYISDFDKIIDKCKTKK